MCIRDSVDERMMNNATMWVYGVYQYEGDQIVTGDFLNGRMNLIRELLLNMWIIKDNAVNVELGLSLIHISEPTRPY